MAFSTNDGIEKFGAALDTLTAGGGTSAVANAAMSATADANTWTNDEDAVMATVIGQFEFGAGTVTSNTTIDLFARLMNIDGATDAQIPAVTEFEHIYVGSFPLTDAGGSPGLPLVVPIEISLPNAKSSQEYDFYIKNNSGIQISAAWTLKIMTKAIGPKS